MGEQIGLLVIVDEPAPLSGHRPTPAMAAKFLATSVSRSIWPHLHDYLYLRRVSTEHGEQPGGPPVPPSKAGALWSRGTRLVERMLARSAMANFVAPENRLQALRQPAVVPMFQLFLIHARETFTYEPRAYPHGLTLFCTEEVRRARGRADPTMGWGKLAAGGVEVHSLGGDHLSLLKSPNVQQLATALTSCLTRARSARDGRA
jgi:hypothetical protein